MRRSRDAKDWSVATGNCRGSYKHLIVYLKEEKYLGADREAGLDAVAQLVNEGVCIGISMQWFGRGRNKMLPAGFARARGSQIVISGIGERPAVVTCAIGTARFHHRVAMALPHRLTQMILRLAARRI